VVGATVTGDAEVGLAVLGALEGVEVTGALVGEGVINGAMGLGVGSSETGASEVGSSVGAGVSCGIGVGGSDGTAGMGDGTGGSVKLVGWGVSTGCTVGTKALPLSLGMEEVEGEYVAWPLTAATRQHANAVVIGTLHLVETFISMVLIELWRIRFANPSARLRSTNIYC